jgi:hypothetical protein
VLSAASVGGTFGFVTFTGFPAGTQLAVVYDPTSVVVRVIGSAGIEAPLAAPEALPSALGFTGITTPEGEAAFELALPGAAAVSVSLYDIAGRRWRGSWTAARARLAPALRRRVSPAESTSGADRDGWARESRTARVVVMIAPARRNDEARRYPPPPEPLAVRRIALSAVDRHFLLGARRALTPRPYPETRATAVEIVPAVPRVCAGRRRMRSASVAPVPVRRRP